MIASDRLRHAPTRLLIGATLLALGGAAGPAWSQAEGTGMPSADRLKTPSGQEIFQRICQGCHMPDAKGAIGAGAYPALAGNARLAAALYPITVVVNGQRAMPPFGADLSDVQIANVINYVRTHFGNHYKDPVLPAAVRAARR